MNEQEKETVKGAPPMVSPYEAAELLLCSPRTVTRMCERGELKACKAGNRWRVNRKSLMEYMGAER